MLLRNAVNMASLRNKATGTMATYYKDTTGATAVMSGGNITLANIITNNNYNETGTSGTSMTHIGVAIGTGTTTPTMDDYKLQNHITLGNVATSNTINATSNWGSNHLVSFTQSLSNNTASEIEITEIGLFVASSGSGGKCWLFTRDVISPVKMAVGETKTFVVTIDYEQMATSVQAS